MCCSVLSPQMKNHLYSWLFHSRTINYRYLNFSAKSKEKICSSNHNAHVIMFGGGGGFITHVDVIYMYIIIDHDIKIFVHHGRVHVWCPRI